MCAKDRVQAILRAAAYPDRAIPSVMMVHADKNQWGMARGQSRGDRKRLTLVRLRMGFAEPLDLDREVPWMDEGLGKPGHAVLVHHIVNPLNHGTDTREMV